MALKNFRKKPVIVQAEQWHPGEEVEGVTSLVPELGLVPNPVVYTPNGPVRIEPGEWIITGAAGEKYPCKKEIFELTYEPVDEALLKQEADAGVEEVRSARAAQELDRVREVIRELVEGNPVVQPERVADWLAVFIATSRDFDRERAETVRRLTIDLTEARRYMPTNSEIEVVQVVDGVEVVEGGAFSEHDDG